MSPVVPSAGETNLSNITSSYSCSQSVPPLYACKGKLSGRIVMNGWPTDTSTLIQVDHHLKMVVRGYYASSSQAFLSYEDGCTGATAALSSCTRFLNDNQFTWSASNSSGGVGVNVCLEATGSANYRAQDLATKQWKTYNVISSDHRCFNVGGGSGQASVPD